MSKIKIKSNFAISYVWVSILLIVVSVSELGMKTERLFYPICIIILVLCFVIKGVKIKLNSSILLILYLIYSLLSCLWTPAVGIDAYVLSKTTVLSCLVLQLQFDYDTYDYLRIKNAFLIQFILIVAAVLLWGEVRGDGRLWIINGRITTDPNSLSAWVFIPASIFIERVFASNRKNKIVSLVGLIISGAIVFAGASRAAFIVFTSFLLMSTIYTFRNVLKRNPMYAILFVLFVVVVGLIVFNNLPESVVNRFNNASTSDLGGRAEIWKGLLETLLKHPLGLLFGMGEYSAHYYVAVAHSMYLDTLFSQGVIGLMLVVSYILLSIKKLWKRDPYMAIGVISVCFMGATLSEFTSRSVMLAFFILGMNVLLDSNGISERYN